MLTGDPCGDGGGVWDDDAASPSRRKVPKVGPTWWAQTIEEVLGAWTRDPSSLVLIDKKVRQYLKLYEAQSDAELTADDRAIVADFHSTWQILRRALVTEQQ